MHELPITQELWKRVCDQARENGVEKVKLVRVSLGELAGYVDESIDFYWEIVAKDSVAEGAKVEIKRIEGKVKCLSCGDVGKKKSELCKKCGSHRLEIMAGGDMVLESIEGD